ncbi:MAG TPA: recombinase family protein [Rubrobacter sp.]|nr:recombinase family protein [Rubrobacter sp.]
MILEDGFEVLRPSSQKIGPSHLERLAVVYVRQSTAQQVLEHQESTRLQYGLLGRAQRMGWPKERVLVIDDDLGISGASSEGRRGFSRLVSEVSLNHVGMILGVEMSRLARSSKDWHQLLEICAIFATLISDLDGVYDPSQYNDRLLLGLKGTMSEAELHVIKQRMNQGKLNKAQRGELAFSVPTGYVRQASGEVIFDPDEEVQRVVRLIFRKFEELGTLHGVLAYLVEHGVKLGIRVRQGEAKGKLEWRRPNRMTLQNVLKHPIYAGAYTYGRRRVDPRKQKPGRPSTGRTVAPRQAWHVLIKDRLPAYISWEGYERNLGRLAENRARADAMGASREGPSLLQGLLVCGKCSARMTVRYGGSRNRHTYVCGRQSTDYGGEVCQYLSGPPLDEFISERVLEALKPAALELSLEAAKNLESEREELDRLWKMRLERAAYEVERAGRHYRLLEPENRLVGRQLAKDWEEKLATEQKLKEDYRRFSHEQPRPLSAAEREAIQHLSEDIPALWEATSTTDKDRKEIVRQVIERIIIDAEGKTERVRVRIEWAGGTTTESIMIRPVAKLKHLSYYPKLCERVRSLAAQGMSAATIAGCLNEEGYRPPKRREGFDRQSAQDLIHRLGLSRQRLRSEGQEDLGRHEYGGLGSWLASWACPKRRSTAGCVAAGCRHVSSRRCLTAGSCGPTMRSWEG